MYKLVNYSDTLGNTTYFKIVCTRDYEKKPVSRGTIDVEEVHRVSLSRTKKHIKEIALCNNFEYFATLTINSKSCDRYSLTDCQDRLKKILKAFKRKNKDFAYIFITEKHKDGAFHFHGLIKGVSDFYINSNGYLSHTMFDKIGFNSFSKIKDYNKTCNYIMKYITKDCVKNEHNQIYISSRGLKKAISEEILPVDLSLFKTNYHNVYTNDFCSIIEFSCDELSLSQKLLFIEKIKNKINFRNNIDTNYII